MYNPYIQEITAKLRQEDFLLEAQHRRLIHEYNKQTSTIDRPSIQQRIHMAVHAMLAMLQSIRIH